MGDRPAIGTILYSSWGYDQTNVDWYQVVKLSGKQSVTLRKIRSVETDDSPTAMTGKCTPAPDHFMGPDIRRRWKSSSYGDFIKIKSYAYAYLWDGEPRRFSSYA